MSTTTDPLRIALAAKRWADAEQEKAFAKRVFSDAAHECIDWRASAEVGKTVWLFSRLSGTDPMTGEWKSRWVWRETGADADSDPRVIRQRNAWTKLVAARRAAGAARGALTRMARRWTA